MMLLKLINMIQHLLQWSQYQIIEFSANIIIIMLVCLSIIYILKGSLTKRLYSEISISISNFIWTTNSLWTF